MDPELIRQRMMRGALTGPAEKEKEPVKYCKGLRPGGRKCRVVVVGDGDLCRECQKAKDTFESSPAVKAAEPQISPVAAAPPQEAAEVLPEPVSTLSRLLRPAQPPTPPLPATFIVLDFDQDEFAAIQAEKVTAHDIKQLTLMLIAGELGKIIEVEDPLAKSRRAE